MSEHISSNSDIFQDADQHWPRERWTNIWHVHNDSLSVTSTEPYTDIDVSHLLFFCAEDFPVVPYRESLDSEGGWFPNKPYSSGLTEGSDLVTEVNIRIDNTGLVLDGPNMIYYFEPSGRVLRTISVSTWDGYGFGWELIDE